MTSSLRMLFVTADEFPSYRPDVDSLFGKQFLALGHSIDWIACGPAATSGLVETRWRGCRAWIAPSARAPGMAGRMKQQLLALRNALRMFRLARRERYDFLQIKDLYLAAIIGIAAARSSGTKLFYWHSFPFPEASQLLAETPGSKHPLLYGLRAKLLSLLLYRLICPAADHIFVQSEEMKRQMAARGVRADKMTAVPMGVDPELFDDQCRPCTHPTPSAERPIVYLGALDRIRRLDFLIEVLARVRRRHDTAVLYFVGDGHDPSDRELLLSAARLHGVEAHVHITGFLERPVALGYVAAAAVCVSPLPPGPVFDVSSPTKALEYLALGRPVVANGIPDTRDVIDASGGGLCVAYDTSSFSEAICWLLEHRDEADRMGMQGRRYVRQHRSYDVLAERLEEQYQQLLGQARSSTVTTGG